MEWGGGLLRDLPSIRQLKNIIAVLLHNLSILKKLNYHAENAQWRNAKVLSQILPYIILLQANLLQILRG